MGSIIPCPLCGSTVAGHTGITVEDVRYPGCCWDCADMGEVMPVRLGMAIRRFVRRAEVEGLVDVARWNAVRISALNPNCAAGREAQADLDAALSRLAALALEVES